MVPSENDSHSAGTKPKLTKISKVRKDTEKFVAAETKQHVPYGWGGGGEPEKVKKAKIG